MEIRSKTIHNMGATKKFAFFNFFLSGYAFKYITLPAVEAQGFRRNWLKRLSIEEEKNTKKTFFL